MFLVFFSLVCFIVLSRNLMIILIVLEILGFVLLFFIAFYMGPVFSSDYFVLLLFSILVMEGVIALCGLIMLVSYSGSDYLKSSSFLKV